MSQFQPNFLYRFWPNRVNYKTATKNVNLIITLSACLFYTYPLLQENVTCRLTYFFVTEFVAVTCNICPYFISNNYMQKTCIIHNALYYSVLKSGKVFREHFYSSNQNCYNFSPQFCPFFFTNTAASVYTYTMLCMIYVTPYHMIRSVYVYLGSFYPQKENIL